MKTSGAPKVPHSAQVRRFARVQFHACKTGITYRANFANLLYFMWRSLSERLGNKAFQTIVESLTLEALQPYAGMANWLQPNIQQFWEAAVKETHTISRLHYGLFNVDEYNIVINLLHTSQSAFKV